MKNDGDTMVKLTLLSILQHCYAAFFVLMIIGVQTAWSAVYYVDAVAGNDANSGTADAPWATVQKAAAILIAGDTAYIKNGIYAMNNHPTVKYLSPVNSGNAAAGYITFAAYNGHTPVLDGGNARLLTAGGLINIRNKEYIRISGITVKNVDDNAEGIGIYVENSRHIIIEKNHVLHTDSSGIQVFTKSVQLGLPSADIIIENNEVEDTNLGGPNEMITVAGVNRFEVKGNLVHNRKSGTTGGEGIDIKQGSKNGSVHHNEIWDLNTNRPGVYIDAWDQLTENIDVYANHIHHIDTFGLYVGSERGGLLRNIRIFNNIIHDNYRAGICFADESSYSGTEPIENIVVMNNTLAHNGVSINWYGAIYVENPSITGLTIRNNIAWQNGGYQISSIPTTTSAVAVSNNLLWGVLGAADNNRISSSVDMKADPLFVDTAETNFRLQVASPAIDRGDTASLPVDIFDQDGDSNATESIPFDYAGKPRISGNRVDIGAYEYISSVPEDTSPYPWLPAVYKLLL
ncbi:MAG: Right handed beta helix region [Candidatus Electronema aureum]|uniref:Right handed beta helix region n=1 Tax=Candidatus Electronema aureum TaxID=2005002 RepID=A0A521FZK4_9BACT|nr:MAG: Right handed beta helix region [Candidatus Electronema aureum]